MMSEIKKLSLKFCIFIIGLVLFASFVFGSSATIDSPIVNTNYTDTLNISISHTADRITNFTCFYNASGGEAKEDTFWFYMTNSTGENQTVFENSTLDISGFSEYLTYNISCYLWGETGGEANVSVSVSPVGIDSVSPYVKEANFTSPLSYSNNSGADLLLNVSVTDGGVGVGAVYFNITNSSGDSNATYTATAAGDYYSASLNTTDFPDGVYNITVWANDSLNNLNNTAKVYQVTFDNTAPAISLSSSSATRTSLTLTISASDALSGVSSCSVSGGNSAGVVTGTTSLTESGLDCGTEYRYVVNCYDRAGNLGSSTSTAFTTSSCSSGGSSSSSSSSTTSWSNTFIVSDDSVFESEEGYNNQLKSKERVRIKIGSQQHHVGVKSLTATSATIEISSDPITMNLDVGEDAKVDLDSNGFYDLYVKLNSIENNEADVTIKKINEEIPEDVEITQEGVETSGDVLDEEGQPIQETEEKSKTWIWVLIIIVVLIAIGAGVGIKKSKK